MYAFNAKSDRSEEASLREIVSNLVQKYQSAPVGEVKKQKLEQLQALADITIKSAGMQALPGFKTWAETERRGSIEEVSALSISNSGCKRILVVDDSNVLRRIHQRMLERILPGFEIAVAESGEDALRLIMGKLAYDIILMDCHMPGIDGCQTTRLLRRMGFLEPCIIGCSSDPDAKQDFQNSGADGAIDKASTGVSQRLLRRTLGHYLRVLALQAQATRHHHMVCDRHEEK